MKLKPIDKSIQNESFKILEKPTLMHTRDSSIHTYGASKNMPFMSGWLQKILQMFSTLHVI